MAICVDAIRNPTEFNAATLHTLVASMGFGDSWGMATLLASEEEEEDSEDDVPEDPQLDDLDELLGEDDEDGEDEEEDDEDDGFEEAHA